MNGLFVDRKAWRQMTTVYTRFVGAVTPMADLSYAAKRLIMQASMASEVNQLGRHLDRISERNRHSRDFTLKSLTRALREVIDCVPVYRTYVGDDGFEVTARARDYIERAVAEAKRRNATVNVSVLDFVRDTLLLRYPPGADEAERAERRHFVMRFQQTTGPVTAKGVEDTAFCLYHRLVSLNEVGADPARYGEPAGVFHGVHVRRWRMIARRLKRLVDPAPDKDDEYLLYQTLVGAWPADLASEGIEPLAGRVCQYMEKAIKEAKRHTSWINPNPAYDAAVREFVTSLLAPGSPFLDAFGPFQRRVALYGVANSLAQTVLKIAAPGIPDVYQGSERWDLSLVDPDNRQPADFARRQELLESLVRRIPPGPVDLSPLCTELLESWPDGRVKLYLTHRALTLRRERARLFASFPVALLERECKS